LDYLINDYDVKFLNFAQQLQEKKPIIITGDMNVAHTELDLTNPKANKNKNGFTDIQR
jgi:exodeoxyribonuclease-3